MGGMGGGLGDGGDGMKGFEIYVTICTNFGGGWEMMM